MEAEFQRCAILVVSHGDPLQMLQNIMHSAKQHSGGDLGGLAERIQKSRVASVLSQHRKFALLTGELRPLLWLIANKQKKVFNFGILFLSANMTILAIFKLFIGISKAVFVRKTKVYSSVWNKKSWIICIFKSVHKLRATEQWVLSLSLAISLNVKSFVIDLRPLSLNPL